MKRETAEKNGVAGTLRRRKMALLKNQDRLLQELGTGAFGQTYLAEDTHAPSGRRCVIKRLTWNYDPDLAPIIRERFKREAALLEKLGRGSQGSILEAVRLLCRKQSVLFCPGVD